MSEKCDAILVLGGGSNADSELDEYAKDKLDYAAELYMRYQPKAIIVSGGYSYKLSEAPPNTEAQSMKDYLIGRGIPDDEVFKEESSKDTLGNIYFTKVELLVKHGWSDVLVVVSVNHSLKRVDYLLRKILGPPYKYRITANKTNDDNLNKHREAKSLQLTKQLLDAVDDGDDKSVNKIMQEKHVAYSKKPELTKEQLVQFFNQE